MRPQEIAPSILMFRFSPRSAIMGVMANKDLNKAKAAKKDGFYTRLEDIENEIRSF